MSLSGKSNSSRKMAVNIPKRHLKRALLWENSGSETEGLLRGHPKIRNPRSLLTTEGFDHATVIPLGFEPRTPTLKV